MTNNDFLILLQAVLDQSGVKKSLKEIQDIANKTKVKMGIDVDKQASQKAIDSLANSMLSFKNNNSAMTKEMKQSLSSMYNTLINGANLSKSEVDDLRHRFNMLKLEVRDSGKLGKSFGDSIKQGMASFSTWLPASTIIMKIVQSGKALIQNVEEMDDALTNISYTMDVTNTQLEKIGNSSLQTAKDLSTSASKVLDAVKTYANANETMDSIINKAKPTIMMSNVTGMDTEQTVDIIQGTVEQFDLSDTEEQLMHISDVLQTVSMSMPYDFAKGVKELSEGIQASGSVAKDAGYDLENYTALLGTLIAKTRQSGSELGRSLRTMFVRTTKASSSALANGEVTEEDLSNAEKALRRVGIEVRSDIDTFKSFDEIMGELYNKVDSLSEVDLSNIAYEVASTRQNVCLSI